VEVAGESLVALPELALLWPSESTLFIADVHLGKDASMLASGIPIPLGPTTDTLQRLSDVLLKTSPMRLVLLGDLWHAKAGRTCGFTSDFAAWREAHKDIEMILVEGNHDLKSGPLPKGANVLEVKEPHVIGPFALCHYPVPSMEGYVLGGHIHPAVVLQGPGRQSLKLPCFWFGSQVGVLPPFGSFTGCARVSPCEGDQVLVVAEGRVIPARVSD
jgi:DNA ligase-associated metallophosphoesterase